MRKEYTSPRCGPASFLLEPQPIAAKVYAMKCICGILILSTCLGLAVAQEAAPEEPAVEAKKLPSVEEAIPPRVAALNAPKPFDFPGGIVMAVSTPSEKAQKHVVNGLNHLHGGWEFEASRHFAAAMKEDPDCLLAH